MRLFFDVLQQQIASYDFHGLDFGRPEDATQMAELIAADLGCSENNDWVGSHVKVRDVVGKTLFTVLVLSAA
jgi:Domain of unknown function (DUF6894)